MTKLRTTLLLALFLVIVIPGKSHAIDCSNALDQMSMNECAGKNFSIADKKMNKSYNALMAKLGPDSKAKLKTAQKALLAYRDAQCEFDTSGVEGGSVRPMMESQCWEALTIEQTKVIERNLNCEEGDMSCTNF